MPKSGKEATSGAVAAEPVGVATDADADSAAGSARAVTAALARRRDLAPTRLN
jgi:hypothetical protein